MVLMGFHLLVMTTSEQTPPLNKDHLNLIAKYLSSMVKRIKHLQERPPPYKDHFKMFRICAAGLYS